MPETLVDWMFLAGTLCFLGCVVSIAVLMWNAPMPDYTDEELEERRRKNNELAFWICIMS